MDSVYAKIKQRTSENDKFRRVLSTDDMLYPDVEDLISNEVKYSPDTLLEEGDWFYISNFSDTEYCIIPIKRKMKGMDYNCLSSDEFNKIDYIFTIRNQDYFFQNITKSRLISKKAITLFGEDYKYVENNQSLHINKIPDAIYRITYDVLLFKRIESITAIFKGISDLYKEATDIETEMFLRSDFIQLENGFNSCDVKTSNRKKIAIAMKVLERLKKKEKNQIFNYINEYCPEFVCDGKIKISNEKELSILLYGIEQRFYTTPVGKEKRLANSVITL